MELGVDISALNTVYLRNVPPTPPTTPSAAVVPVARVSRRWSSPIARRSVRMISGFFHNAEQMVHGVVRAPPRSEQS